MSVAVELSDLEDKLENLECKVQAVNGTMKMIVMSLDAGIATEQASWVAAGVVYNTNDILQELEQLITATMQIRSNIEKLIT